MPTPPPPEPFLHSQETLGNTQAADKTNANSDADQDASSRPPEVDVTRAKDKDTSEESNSDSSSDNENDGKEEDPELAELLRENSLSGSGSDDDHDVPGDPTGKPTGNHTQRTKKQRSLDRYDSPASNIAVLLLACWTMRVPVMCADFLKHVIFAIGSHRCGTNRLF